MVWDYLGGDKMPDANHLAAIDTLLAVAVTIALAFWVGVLRGRHKVHAPATVGHPDFERGFRTHVNTVENLVLFLPLLWIATIYYGGQIPFWVGLLWVVSRVIYGIGYAQKNAEMREPGAGIGFLSLFALLILAAIGVVR
jgi:glutathione S-transferase